MNGRLENDLKNKAKIKKLLNMMPPCLTDFYNYMTASGELPKSSLEYLRVLKRFFEYLTDDVQNIRIASITQKEVSGFIVSRQTTIKNGQVKKTTNSYQRHIYNALKKFFDFHNTVYNFKMIRGMLQDSGSLFRRASLRKTVFLMVDIS